MDGILMRTTIRILIAAFLALATLSAPALAQFTDQRNYGGTSAGSANAQTITIANMPATVPVGVPIRFIPGFANTTAATLTISGGSGAVALCKPSAAGPVALTGGELQTTQTTEIVSNGTCYVITSSIDSTISGLIVPPQGRLTLSTGVPIMTADVSAATSLFYTPAVGNQVPIYNGSKFVSFSFAELTLTIPSSRLANLLYDVCVFNNSGAAQVVFGPAWSSSTAGSASRGTGAGTAQITRLNGLLVNAVQISGVNGASSFTIAANLCTYVGTVLIDGTNGQMTATFTYGQSRRLSFWNQYNQVPVTLKAGDPTSSWNYSSAGAPAIRPSNNNSANQIVTVTGNPEVPIDVMFQQNVSVNAGPTESTIRIGVNSTVAGTAKFGGSPYTGSPFSNNIANVLLQPGSTTVGPNIFYALEVNTPSGTTSFLGTETFMLLSAQFRY